MIKNKRKIYLLVTNLGISRRLYLYKDGQLTTTRRLVVGEVDRQRKNLHAVAILCRLELWLLQLFWRQANQEDRDGRSSYLQHWLLQSSTSWRRRSMRKYIFLIWGCLFNNLFNSIQDSSIPGEQQTKFKKFYPLWCVAVVDKGHQCSPEVYEDQKFAWSFDGSRQTRPHRDQKSNLNFFYIVLIAAVVLF